jgi:hypothetical protein
VAKIAAFLSSATQHSGGFDIRECELNGRPAILASQNGKTIAAILLSVADGKIRNVFIHADPAHLGHVGAERPAAEHAL